MAKQTFTTGQVLTAAQQNSLQANDFNQTVSVKTANYSLLAADKGTRIEFNTSGSVTCTVNSGQFDAGDTLIIQNRGAGTATITAGTATVNTSASLALSQYSAGTLYFVSDSAALFFGDAAGISASLIDAKGDLIVGTADNTVGRLPVGTNGHTLVADSSVSPQGLKWAVDPVADVITTAGDLIYGTAADTVARLGIGTAGQVLKVNSGATAPEWGAATSGMTFISKTSWSAASSHTVDNVFTSTYTNYMIVIENWISSAFANIPQLQLRYGSTTEASGYYGSSFGLPFNSGTLASELTDNAAAFDFWRYSGESQGTFIVMHIERVGSGSGQLSLFSGQGIVNTNAEQYKFAGTATISQNYTGFVLKQSAGTSSGDVTVYGLAKA